MNMQLLHVSFNINGSISADTLKEKFNLGLDWIHYFSNCWIVKTNSNADKWYERLKPLLGPNDHIFICKIDLSEDQGWLPQWVWDWINKNKNDDGHPYVR